MSPALPPERRVRLPSAHDGFTLIELIVVLVILGVLATIAIPTFLGQRVSAIDAAAKSDARNLAEARAGYDIETNATPSLADLEVDGFRATGDVSHALCQDPDGRFAVGAAHDESDAIFVMSATGALEKSEEVTLLDALNAVMLVDCSGAPQFYDAD